jgi:hypothetical protein
MSATLQAKPQTESRPLTALQQKLADLWLESTFSGLNIPQHELARAAGYGGNSPEALKVIASKALHSPNVRAYLRTRARERMDSAGIEAVAVLARLTTGAESERVRADVAHKVAVGTGMLANDGAAGGANVAIQLVFRQSDGSAIEHAPQVIDVSGDASHPHSLGQGGQDATPPPGGRARTASARGGGSKPRLASKAPPPRTISPPKGRGGRKGGGSGVKSKGGKG